MYLLPVILKYDGRSVPIHGGLKFEGTGLNVAFLMASIGFPMPGTQEAKGEKAPAAKEEAKEKPEDATKAKADEAASFV